AELVLARGIDEPLATIQSTAVRRMKCSAARAHPRPMAPRRRRPGRMAACLVAVLASVGIERESVARGWVDEFQEVAKAVSTACKGTALAECRTGLRRLSELTDGRPDFRCRLAR